jgi:hypothetical protein
MPGQRLQPQNQPEKAASAAAKTEREQTPAEKAGQEETVAGPKGTRAGVKSLEDEHAGLSVSQCFGKR